MDKITIDTYNATAHAYDEETTNYWERFPRTMLDTFARLVQGRVLDVGSGPGRDGLLLQEQGVEVVCLDASEEMVKLCKARGLPCLQGEIAALPFGEGVFAGVWAYTSLLHLRKNEIGAALQEIHRVLCEGGVFGLGLIEGDTEGYRESSGVQLPRWFSFFQKEEVETLLKQSGFEVIFFETFKPATKNYLNFIARSI